MNHHRAGRLLSAYIDGELTAAETRAVQSHLLDCAVCREAYNNLTTTRDLLSGLAPVEPPVEFWQGVRGAAVRAQAVWPRAASWAARPAWRPRWAFPRWPSMRRPAWALAAALVVLLLAAFPLVKGTMDRLHATEIGVDLYVHDHALQMGQAPLVDRAFVGLVTGDAQLVLSGEMPRPIGDDVR